jgi:leucyl aminopeptidase
MNTSIQISAGKKSNDNHVIITENASRFDNSLLDKKELTFISNEVKKKNFLIPVTQDKRTIFLHVIDQKGDAHKIREAFRKAGSDLAAKLNGQHIGSVTVLPSVEPDLTLAYVEGICLSNYQFLRYKSKKKLNSLKKVSVTDKRITKKMLTDLGHVCDAVCRARDLVNEPLNGLNAVKLANAYKAMGKDAGFKVTVFDKKKIQALKMGGLLAVNKGSIDPPTFTIMEYKPAKAKNKKPYVLVGKGVVYDTGGLSLKPTPNSMDYMKSDMGGAAAVGGTIYAIAKMKLPVHVIALVPATDNRPDGNAYVPGDVIKMYSGATVEVLNTDAEGRMILADALHHAKKFKPEAVFEFSTLTGAAANAIGKYGVVCMGDVSDSLRKTLMEAGNRSYERLVEFPYWDEYDELLQSDIADIKNIGGPVGGAITAGRFLSNFTDYPYMHFDIAGPAFNKANDSYRGKNGTGVGVRLMCDFFRSV